MIKILTPRINTWINFAPIIVSLFLILLILITGRFLPSRLPLFYSLPWGDTQLGTQRQFIILPIIIILISLFNSIFSLQLHPSQTFFRKMLLFSSILTSLILASAFLKIIFLFI